MTDHEDPIDVVQERKRYKIETMLILVMILLIFSVSALLIIKNSDAIFHFIYPTRILSFENVYIENGYEKLSVPDGRFWKIIYESRHLATFSGIVSHISPIHIGKFAILTEDILVTTGDFTNPEAVSTHVSNHKFSWRSLNYQQPSGTINLLHTVPMNEDINRMLKEIRQGDLVSIKGYEIFNILGFDTGGNYIGNWQDAGCNSILVTEVEVFENPAK